MRRRILLATVVAGFFFATQAEAQNCNTPELTQKLSIFSEYAKAKNYKEAYPIWKEVYTQCPTLHYATFAYGERILQDKIRTSNGAEKTQFVKELLQMYTDYNKHFASRFNATEMRIRQALLMFDEKAGSEQEIYDLLHKAFTEGKNDFKNEKIATHDSSTQQLIEFYKH